MKAYREVSLTDGKVAIVDTEDYECVSAYKWKAIKKPSGNCYAISNDEETGRLITMHSLIVSAGHHQRIDHKDRNGLNNRKDNLRLCTVTQNNQNRGRFSNNKSGFKGVSPSGRKSKPYRAQIRANKLSIFLGHYRTAEDAARAYDETAKSLFGEFACLNFIETLEGK